MESLYRKYRPLTFDSVVGQQHIVSTLENAVTEGRLGHAYLFCGPRGTGKTTMARILAKALLCEKTVATPEGTGCLPDGTCPECEQIAAGTHPDVYELDAASRTGVDNVREEIINSVSFAPVRGSHKVYIIDEVHMLTTAAFNALLKTLEEPPAHVVFVLCTTDPQKLPETILSRCQRFDFHRISNEDLEGRMRCICEQEGFSYDDEALQIVAKHARGGMRDALSTLEQLSVFGDGAVRTEDARALLGEASDAVLGSFAHAIAARDVVALFGLIRAQVEEGNDLLELARDLVAHLRDVYTARVAGDDPDLFDSTPEEVRGFVAEAAAFESTDRVARTLIVLDDAALEMRTASDARLVLEIACTRLARPESDLTLEALAERLDRVEAQLASGVPSAPMDVRQLEGTSAAGATVREGAAQPAIRQRHGAGATGGAESEATGAAAGGKPVSGGARQAPAAAPAERASGAASAAGGALPWERGAAIRHTPAAKQGAPTEQARASAPAQQPARPVAQTPKPSVPAPTAAPVAPSPAPAVTPPASPAAPSTPAAADAGELQRRWADVVKRVIAAQPARGALLQSARALADTGDVLTVGLPKGSNFAFKMLGRADSQAVINPIVCTVFGTRTVEYVMGEGPGSTPKAEASRTPVAASGPSGVAAAGPAPARRPGAEHAGTAGRTAQAAVRVPQPSGTAQANTAQPGPSAAAADRMATEPEAVVQSRPQPQPQPVSQPTPQPAAPAPTGATESGNKPAAPDASDGTVSSAPPHAAASGDELPPWEAVPAQAHIARAPNQAPAPATPAAPNNSADTSNHEPDRDVRPAGTSGHPPVDHMTGPTVVPEPDVDAQRRAWEDEQVPYDDATIAAYEQDDEFAAPAAVPATPATPEPTPSRPAATAPATTGASAASSTPQANAPATGPIPHTVAPGAKPWEGTDSVQDEVPQTPEASKEMLSEIFGSGIVFKSTDE